MNFIKHYIWFIRESYSFMGHRNKVWITFASIPKAFGFAKNMCQWDKMTPVQRENWYTSGEGRVFEI